MSLNDDLTRTHLGSGGPRAGEDTDSLPSSIGEYRILGKLGEGGFGVVYEAEQISPKRVVALKVIRGEGAVSDTHLAMFRREVEVLARLEHPMIARIYASGRTPEGRHFFAMEFVRGATLSDFLARHPGPLDAAELRFRLTLLADIAEAVHYAHQRGVIHRDLKPSNLIVTEEDSASGRTDSLAARARVKILDFGLARITDADVAATRVTEIGTIRGTLPYMSPEQTRGRPDAIDVRTDVYALGVILYEMLTGKLPLDLTTMSLVEAVRQIEQGRPRPLRELWRGARRVDVDLETIVDKALEKDANDRYGSAAALAEDVRRHLGSQPILARPPSMLYQLRKLVRRNPLPAAFAGAVLLLLVAFAGTMAWQARRIADERDRAQAEADTSAAIREFLQQTLLTADPYAGGSREVTILDALGRSEKRIETAFSDKPLVEAEVRQTIGAIYMNLGQYDKGEPLLKRAVDLRIEHQGPNHQDTATAWGQLSRFYHIMRRTDEAIAAAEKGIAAQRAADPGSFLLGERLDDLGYAYFVAGKFEEAEKPAREAVEIGRAAVAQGQQSRVLGESLSLLADVLSNQAKVDEAVPVATEALDVAIKSLGAENPATDHARNSLAMIVMQKGDFDQAEKLLVEVLDNTKRNLGPKHPQVAVTLENLGNVYYRSDRLDRTIELLDEAATLRREVLGPNDPAVGRTYANKGMVLWRAKRLEESEASLREGLALMSSGENADHPDVAYIYNALASVRMELGDSAGAESALRESLRIWRVARGDEDQLTAAAEIDLGLQLLSRKKDVQEARTLLESGVGVLGPAAGEEDERVKAARTALATAN
jgi:eukaryotic-like serine/threonine-protein kinase